MIDRGGTRRTDVMRAAMVLLIAAAGVGCLNTAVRRVSAERALIARRLPAERAPRLTALYAALRDPSPAVRGAAARILALEFHLAPDELKPLIAAIRDPDPRVRAEVARALLIHLPLRATGAASVPGKAPGAGAAGGDPGALTYARELNRRNLELLRELRRASELRSRPPAMRDPLPDLLDQATQGAPLPVGSQVPMR
jgi:hypothetical protein